MSDADLIESLNNAENNFKQGINQLTQIIRELYGDVENLKVKTFKPDKLTAEVLLEHIAMEDCKTKRNMEIICGKEIKQYMKWLDHYCEKTGCSLEDALNEIISGN